MWIPSCYPFIRYFIPKPYKSIRKACCLGGGGMVLRIHLQYLKYPLQLMLTWCCVHYNLISQNSFICVHSIGFQIQPVIQLDNILTRFSITDDPYVLIYQGILTFLEWWWWLFKPKSSLWLWGQPITFRYHKWSWSRATCYWTNSW